jgi:hypothetical protein
MAGAGYKLFVNGNTLSASDLNTYVNQQTVMVFATTGARDTALSGVLAEGMQCYITGTGGFYYNGSAWVANVTASSTTTFTNKTLTAPVISGSVSGTTILQGASAASGTLTFPAATDTLIGKATTDTLTNKTLTSPVENNPYITSPKELTTVSATAATGTVNFDILTQGVLYYTTSASANFTLNFRGNGTTTLASIMNVGDAWSTVFLNTNGATPYYPNTFQVDGTATGVTVKWSGGTAPSAGNASAVDAYSFTIIKTAATPTYTVLAGGAVKFA